MAAAYSKRADPQVAGGNAGQHGAGQGGLALHQAARRHHGQGARGRDAQRMHRLADDVFAQHRTHCRQPVTAARERSATRTFEVNVAQPPVGVGEFAEQQRATVAQPRDVSAELVPGVNLRDRRGTVGDVVADQEAHPVGTAQPCRVEAQLAGQRCVERQQPRIREV